MGQEELPQQNNFKDPFKDSFTTVEEFSHALEEHDEITIMNSKNILEGKKGEILYGMGTDGKFYLLIRKEKEIKYIGTADSLPEAQTQAGKLIKEIN